MNKQSLFWTLGIALSGIALAFCGFYVAKADTELFNESSKVVIARDGDRTILTMANDFKGDVKDFAMVVPIPYVFTQEQIQVGDPSIIERLDAYSAPRLVEYFDDDPCLYLEYERDGAFFGTSVDLAAPTETARQAQANALGVTIEDQFSVGEYDILILSAEQSDGLFTWLNQNDYRVPEGSTEVIERYIDMDMKWFVARVNLEEFDSSGYQQLRPLMMAFESEDFMLPIQLGMVNAAEAQDLVMYLLSPEGRVELENYRIETIPSDINLPEFVENEFGDFYGAMFKTSYEREDEKAVFLEYAWDMSWCDPCAADPLSQEELLDAGVFWLDDSSNFGAPNVYLTRLHARYTPDKFKEDLMFKTTQNRENFQGRYILQRPFDGAITCEEGQGYIEQVRERQKREAQTLANLTGWSMDNIRASMGQYNPSVEIPEPRPWWERVFRSGD